MNTPQRLCLILDQGGHSTRARVFDEMGSVVAAAQQAVDTQMPSPDYVEQDPALLLQSMDTVLSDIARQLDARCIDLFAAALIVQRASLLAWNRETGVAITPVISWQDTRHLAWFYQHISGRDVWLRHFTGLRPNAHYGASKVRWVLDNHPAVQQAQKDGLLCIGPLASYLQQSLTRAPKPLVDAVIASRMLLTALGTCNWSDELLDFFCISRSVLPDIKPTLDEYGVLTVGQQSVPLRLLGGDQSFFAVAWGEMAPDTVYINIGTGAFLQQHMPVAHVPPDLLASPLLWQPDRHLIVAEATVNAAASALDWLWQQHAVSLTADELEAALRDSIHCKVPVFFARMLASGSPDWLPAGESVFSFDADLPMQAVAVLESVMFALQRNLDCLSSRSICRRVVVSGGLSQLDGFCQRLADLSGVRVCRASDVEASARGAAQQLLPQSAYVQEMTVFEPQPFPALLARYESWTAGISQAV